MKDSMKWQDKLDAYLRMKLESGHIHPNTQIMLRLANKEDSMVPILNGCGLRFYTQVGDIVAGDINDCCALQKIAQLPDVVEIYSSQGLLQE